MKRIAMLLIVCLALITISGCAKPVLTKCKVEHVEEPILDYDTKKDLLGESKRCLTNFTKQKEYSEKLLKASSKCQ